jgi:FlgN protein
VIAVLAHLQRQVESARRLLGVVLAQGEAIRRQDVEGVFARLADVQTELVERVRLERERDDLLARAAGSLGRAAEELDLEDVLTLAPEHEVAPSRAASAELRGLLVEIGRVHEQNRLLIRQELTFLDHLMRVLSGTPQAGYVPGGSATAPQSVNVVDARA